MGTYVNFNTVTADALRYACESLALNASDAQINALFEQYVHLDTFTEVKGALTQLKAGRKLAILSNGAPDTLNALVKNSGLGTVLDATLSVDSIGVFKPDMRIYRMAEETLGVPKARTGFVSSNCWDAIAAKNYGFTVFWINRLNAPVDRHGPQPDYIVQSLDDVVSRA
jgi:2-haloacid dehalogenase